MFGNPAIKFMKAGGDGEEVGGAGGGGRDAVKFLSEKEPIRMSDITHKLVIAGSLEDDRSWDTYVDRLRSSDEAKKDFIGMLTDYFGVAGDPEKCKAIEHEVTAFLEKQKTPPEKLESMLAEITGTEIRDEFLLEKTAETIVDPSRDVRRHPFDASFVDYRLDPIRDDSSNEVLRDEGDLRVISDSPRDTGRPGVVDTDAEVRKILARIDRDLKASTSEYVANLEALVRLREVEKYVPYDMKKQITVFKMEAEKHLSRARAMIKTASIRHPDVGRSCDPEVSTFIDDVLDKYFPGVNFRGGGGLTKGRPLNVHLTDVPSLSIGGAFFSLTHEVLLDIGPGPFGDLAGRKTGVIVHELTHVRHSLVLPSLSKKLRKMMDETAYTEAACEYEALLRLGGPSAFGTNSFAFCKGLPSSNMKKILETEYNYLYKTLTDAGYPCTPGAPYTDPDGLNYIMENVDYKKFSRYVSISKMRSLNNYLGRLIDTYHETNKVLERLTEMLSTTKISKASLKIVKKQLDKTNEFKKTIEKKMSEAHDEFERWTSPDVTFSPFGYRYEVVTSEGDRVSVSFDSIPTDAEKTRLAETVDRFDGESGEEDVSIG